MQKEKYNPKDSLPIPNFRNFDEPNEMNTNGNPDEQRFNIRELDMLEQSQAKEFEEWKCKEEMFEFKQAVIRAKIKISKFTILLNSFDSDSNRAKEIDKIFHLYLFLDNHIELDSKFLKEHVKFPYKVLEKLNFETLKSVRNEIIHIANLNPKSFKIFKNIQLDDSHTNDN